jgi:hypothetical protein
MWGMASSFRLPDAIKMIALPRTSGKPEPVAICKVKRFDTGSPPKVTWFIRFIQVGSSERGGAKPGLATISQGKRLYVKLDQKRLNESQGERNQDKREKIYFSSFRQLSSLEELADPY